MGLPYDFWQQVENKQEYVLYGDSVAEYSRINLKSNGQLINMSVVALWDYLISMGMMYECIQNHEYVYIDNRIEIETSIDGKNIIFKQPKYLMRHKFNGKLLNLLVDENDIKITKNHSLINIIDNKLIKISPLETNVAIVIDRHSYINNYNRLIEFEIQFKEEVEYDGYVYDFEVPKTHNFIIDGVLVHNTDSIYINLPIDSTDIEKSMEISQKIAIEINDMIRQYLNQFILSKMNIDPEHNFTFFKTELTAHSIIFLETKKNYAFKASSIKNKVLPKAKVEYVGIPIVKVNTPQFSSDFIRTLVEDIALTDIPRGDIQEKLNETAKQMFALLETCINEMNIAYIGSPGKWNNTKNDNSHVTGMRLYNSLTNTETFKPLVSGYSIGIKIRNISVIEKQIKAVQQISPLYYNTAINNINFISIPYDYNPQEIQKLFNDYGIYIEKSELFYSLYNTVAERIVATIKTYAGIPLK